MIFAVVLTRHILPIPSDFEIALTVSLGANVETANALQSDFVVAEHP